MGVKKFLIWLLFIFGLFLVFWGWWPNNNDLLSNGNFAIYLAVGRLSGLVLVYLILWQLLLISRVRWLEAVFGLGSTTVWHHRAGYAVLVLLFVHPIFLNLAYGYGENFWLQLVKFFTQYEGLATAIISVILFILLVIFSIIFARVKSRYEVWYFTHLLLYAAIILAWGHQLKLGSDLQEENWFYIFWICLYIFTIINLLFYRFLRPLYFFYKYRFRVEKIIKENENVVSLYISGRQLKKFKWQAGQFAIWRFLAKGYWYEAHPFSIASISGGDHLRITVKALGDFTKKLANLPLGTPVILDGPAGIFVSKAAKKNKVLLLAGGAGVTPIRAILEDLATKKDIILLFSNRQESDIIFRQELENLAQEHKFKVHFILSQADQWSGERGVIDLEKIRRLSPDYLERDIYVCGPAPMMMSIIKLLRGAGVKNSQIHWEKFSLS